jgi:predicted RND superfamily exporter protein
MTPSIGSLVVRYRFALTIGSLIMAGAMAWGMQFSTFDGTTDSILSEGDPYKAEVDQARIDFPPSASMLVAFEVPGDIFTFKTLSAIEELTQRYIEVDSALAVSSILNYRLNESDKQTYGRTYLIPELDTLSEADLVQIKEIALADEDLVKSLLSPQGDFTIASIKFKVSEDTAEKRLAVAESAVALRDSIREKFPEVGLYIIGGPMFERDSHLASVKDNQILFPLVMFVGLVLLWFCLRSLMSAFSLFVLTAVTLAVTLGSHALLGIPLNQISRLGPLVVAVIAMADGIHIVSVYAQGLLRGLDKESAMVESLNINFTPIALATITTTMGFLSLNFSSAPTIYGFGNIIAIGVCWAFVFTIMLLPTMILLMPVNRVPKPLGVGTFISAMTRLVETRERTLFWGSLGLILLTLCLLPLNKLDSDRFAFIDKDSDARIVLTALREKIGSDQSLVYVIRSSGYYGITDPAFLQEVNRFTEWLEEQQETSFVASYTDYLKVRNKADHDDDEAYNVVPDDQLTVIDYLVGYQLVQEIEPSLQPIFNADYSAVRLAVATSNLSNVEILNFADKIDAWAQDNVSPDFAITRGDNTILYARINQTISSELLKGFSLSFLLITLTMIVGLRSLKYGLLSIFPNVFPATIVFGFWGLFQGLLSPYTLMLFSISIGLVVDDSVHILSKYISAKREGATPIEAVRYSIDKAGSAITITTLSLAVGTFLLVFSSTSIFQNVALLITPIIVTALFLDLLFLPPLLMRFDAWLDRIRGIENSDVSQPSQPSPALETVKI